MEHLWKIVVLIVLFVMIPRWLWSQETKTKLALLKYKGGGDWYANPTSLPNLIRFCNENLQTDLAKEPATVEPASRDIFNYPYIHMTGHGNIVFTEVEAQNLREYLLAGGFLHADDNYGLADAFRREMKKVFPEDEFMELPWEHPIFHQKYKFSEGLPKIHEHDNKRQQALQMGANIISYVFRN